jgi:hypothetical protein
MKKCDELSQYNSCWNKAELDETIFVLLSRDLAAPKAIRCWVKERVRLGKNQPGDPQTTEALECADAMEKEYYERYLLRKLK